MFRLQTILALLRAGEALPAELTAAQALALATEAANNYRTSRADGAEDADILGEAMSALATHAEAAATTEAADAESARLEALAGQLTAAVDAPVETPVVEAVEVVEEVRELALVASSGVPGQLRGAPTGNAVTPPIVGNQGNDARPRRDGLPARFAAIGSVPGLSIDLADKFDIVELARRVKGAVDVMSYGAKAPMARMAAFGVPTGERLGGTSEADVERNTRLLDEYTYMQDSDDGLRKVRLAASIGPKAKTAAAWGCGPAEIDYSQDTCWSVDTPFTDAINKVPLNNCKWGFLPDIPFGGVDDPIGYAEWTPAMQADCNGGAGPVCLTADCAPDPTMLDPDKWTLCFQYSENQQFCNPEQLAKKMKWQQDRLAVLLERYYLGQFDKAADANGQVWNFTANPANIGSAIALMQMLSQLQESTGGWEKHTNWENLRVVVPRPFLKRIMLDEMGVGGRAPIDALMSIDSAVREFGFAGIVGVSDDAFGASPASGYPSTYTTLTGGTLDAPVPLPFQSSQMIPVRFLPNSFNLATGGNFDWGLEKDPACQKFRHIWSGYHKTFSRGCAEERLVWFCSTTNSARIGQLEPVAAACPAAPIIP
ncbi:MAG: hypothetical protein ACRCW4_14175 [Candidatus Neomicrothrix subdominans]